MNRAIRDQITNRETETRRFSFESGSYRISTECWLASPLLVTLPSTGDSHHGHILSGDRETLNLILTTDT